MKTLWLMTLKICLSVTMLLSILEAAGASTTCEPLRTAGLTRQAENCERIVKSGSVKNRAALAYSIRVLTENLNGLKDSRCALNGITPSQPAGYCDDCKSREWIERGIKNDCSLTINDLNSKWRGMPYRSTGYFIDLCADDPKDLVTSFYINRGRGAGNRDVINNDDSLAGAFMLEGKVEDNFYPMNSAKYQGVRDRNDGKIPVIRMVGLNSSNNDGEFNKPLHVAPPNFRSSLGCLGVSEAQIPTLRKIASHGSSLLVQYAGAKFEEKGSCFNDNSDDHRRNTTPAVTSPATDNGANR